MWIDFEERLSKVFAEEIENNQHPDALGHLFLTFSNTTNPAYVNDGVRRPHAINQAQIHAGWRRLRVMHTVGQKEIERSKEAMEQGASLVFSQNVTGKVAVFLYPFKSDLASVKEELFILYYNLEPTDLTENKLRKCLKKFAYYCAATSSVSFDDWSGRWLRFRLSLLDLRNRDIQKKGTLTFLEKSLIILLAVLGVWATLFTGAKWPPWR